MEEISLEKFMQNSACDKPMVVKNGDEEVCVVLNNEEALIDLVVPKMQHCDADNGQSIEAMKAKAQKLAQNIKTES